MNQITKEVYDAFGEISKMGLIDVTTKKQGENGTRVYYDRATGVNYATYEKGYVRRLIPNYHSRFKAFHMYPVNPRIDSKREWVSKISGEVISYTIKGYQLVLDPVERLELLGKAVRNYRVTKTREHQKRMQKKYSQ
jgi:hypothetical protein